MKTISYLKYLSFLVLIVALGISYYLVKDEPETFPLYRYRTKENENKYTRGQIHYLSMDSGMLDCWNDTVKKLVFLGCPYIEKNSNIEIELVFILTSCFCESIGSKRITCRISEKANTTKKYVQTVKKCSVKKCYTKFGHDGYETISTRMKELCFYIQEEMKYDKEMIKCCEKDELIQLRSIVSGDREDEFYPKLKHMNTILFNMLLSREKAETSWLKLNTYAASFWRIWDDVKFRLRLGQYRNVPRY